MVKKRKIQQVSEDDSKGTFIKLFKDWIVNPLKDNDFGFDFDVRLTSQIDGKTQEVSETSFYVQNKSSINSKEEKAIEDLSIDDWELYLGQRIPVLIVKYDIPKNIFYWEIAQEYVWDKIEKEDPNWKRQKTKRIILTKKIDDLEEIKKAVLNAQNRITRYHSLNLGVGEGIKITDDDLSELTKTKDKSLNEYKALSLREGYIEKKKGNTDNSLRLFTEVYNSPKNDEAKIRAIIGIIFEFNIVKIEENKKIVDLANEAIKLSEDLKIIYLKDYINILKNQAILFTIIHKMSEIQMGLKVQEVQKENLFSFFYNQELIKLNKFHSKVVDEINNSLKNLLSTKNIYYYLASLPILIDIATSQTMLFAAFNQKIIDEEIEGRKRLIEQCEFVLEKIPDPDLKKMIFRSLANYYYWTKNNEKAIKYMKSAIELGKQDNDNFFVEGNSKLLKQMSEKPNPYAIPKQKRIDEMTSSEYQEITKKLLQTQGINLENDDKLTSSIKIALDDMNPVNYFKHCKNLHIKYLSTSPVGVSIGLPSMGGKFIWCKHCKNSLSGFNLNALFKSFIETNCKNCKHISKRDGEWKCLVEWVKKQEQDEEFVKVIENLKDN